MFDEQLRVQGLCEAVGQLLLSGAVHELDVLGHDVILEEPESDLVMLRSTSVAELLRLGHASSIVFIDDHRFGVGDDAELGQEKSQMKRLLGGLSGRDDLRLCC